MITNQKPFIYRFFVVLGEIVGLNLILLAMRPFFFEEMPQYADAYGEFSFVLSICYFVCGMQTGSRLHYAFIRGDEILRRALYSNIYFDLLVITLSLARDSMCGSTSFPYSSGNFSSPSSSRRRFVSPFNTIARG